MQDGAIVVRPRVIRVSGLAWWNYRPVRMQRISTGSLVDRALSPRYQIEQQLLTKGETMIVKREQDLLSIFARAQLKG